MQPPNSAQTNFKLKMYVMGCYPSIEKKTIIKQLLPWQANLIARMTHFAMQLVSYIFFLQTNVASSSAFQVPVHRFSDKQKHSLF
jgi:hypothetical protein